MKENDIRPQDIFEEYLRLCKQDAATFFGDAAVTTIACPACGADGVHTFSKDNFSYAECPACKTLFANPRPLNDFFSRYYKDAPSTRFWAEQFYKATAEARREKIWKPKARIVADILAQYGCSDAAIVDIGGGYGIFAEEIANLTTAPVVVIEPSLSLSAVCRSKGLTVQNCFLAETDKSQLPEGRKCYVSFELFEHLQEPNEFVGQVFDLMDTGDLFIFTTLSGTGVDIQTLWEHSKSVSPPHHLNFFNPQSIVPLLERAGFAPLAVSTPGKLDLDIMLNSIEHVQDRFWKHFLTTATEDQRNAMQQWLAENNFSSHMLVIARKP